MVTTSHHHHTVSHRLGNSEMMNNIQSNFGFYDYQMGCNFPYSSTMENSIAPLYDAGSIGLIPMNNSDVLPQIQHADEPSPIFNNTNDFVPLPLRKRPRETYVGQSSCSPFSVLGHDVSRQIQQHQLDMDQLISLHMQRVKMEVGERRKKEEKRIMEVIDQRLTNTLISKDVQINELSKMNIALHQQLNSLFSENQIWRNLAQKNEAVVNSLRCYDLRQALMAEAQLKEGRGAELERTDDAQSVCESSSEGEEMIQTLKGEMVQDKRLNLVLCKNCRKEESCVLVMPCRHLCLCAVCSSNIHTCPTCQSTITTTVKINMFC